MNEGPNRVVWLVIVGLCVLVVAGAWTANTLFNVSVPGHDTTPITLNVAVAPEAYDAVQAAIQAYQSRNPRVNTRPIQVTLTRVDGVEVLRKIDQASYTAPAVWIAESEWMLAAAQDGAPLPKFALTGDLAPRSVARSYMVWGAFQVQTDRLNADYGGLGWHGLHDALAAGAGPLTPALAYPKASAEGLAVVLGAAADYHGRPSLSGADVSNAQFQDWFAVVYEAIPLWDVLGGDPARIIAELGPSQGNVGYILESDWLRRARAAQQRGGPLTFAYPPITVVFDFPYAIWGGLDDPERRAALDLRTYLLNEWSTRADYGLRAPAGPANGGLFASSGVQGVEAEPVVTPVVVPVDTLRATSRWATNSLTP